MTAFPYAAKAVSRLHDAKMVVALVSNADGTIARELEANGICQVGDGPGFRVETIIDSHVVGVGKPDPEIFHLALNALGLETGDGVVMVGDSAWSDMEGAKNAGIKGIHIDRLGTCEGETHDHACDLPRAVDLILQST